MVELSWLITPSLPRGLLRGESGSPSFMASVHFPEKFTVLVEDCHADVVGVVFPISAAVTMPWSNFRRINVEIMPRSYHSQMLFFYTPRRERCCGLMQAESHEFEKV
jgi:hypothetical protein